MEFDCVVLDHYRLFYFARVGVQPGRVNINSAQNNFNVSSIYYGIMDVGVTGIHLQYCEYKPDQHLHAYGTIMLCYVSCTIRCHKRDVEMSVSDRYRHIRMYSL